MRTLELDFIPLCPPNAGPRIHGRGGVLLDIGAAIGGIASGVGSAVAGSEEADAAKHAADLQAQATANALDFTKTQYQTSQTNAAPYLSAGATALGQLTAGTAPGGSLVTPYQDFTAPTGVDESNDPGYQFRLQQGQQALLRGAAAAGGAFSGGTEKALARYGQDYASNEYTNVYNRSLSTYGTNENNYYTGQGNNFNRLSSIAGMGQTANGQATNAGTGAAANYSSTALGGANAQGNYLTQGASAAGAGILGVGNSINNGINNYQNGQILSQLATPDYTAANAATMAGYANTPGNYGYGGGSSAASYADAGAE